VNISQINQIYYLCRGDNLSCGPYQNFTERRKVITSLARFFRNIFFLCLLIKTAHILIFFRSRNNILLMRKFHKLCPHLRTFLIHSISGGRTIRFNAAHTKNLTLGIIQISIFFPVLYIVAFLEVSPTKFSPNLRHGSIPSRLP
jgi:hypothetical protein